MIDKLKFFAHHVIEIIEVKIVISLAVFSQIKPSWLLKIVDLRVGVTLFILDLLLFIRIFGL